MSTINLFTKSTLVKASSGSSKEAATLIDSSPETSWTSAGSAAQESDPASARHVLTFTLRGPSLDREEDDEEGEQAEEEGVNDEPQEEIKVPIGKLEKLVLTFQGGYSALGVVLLAQEAQGEKEGKKGWRQIAQVWPEDANARQEFPISKEGLQEEFSTHTFRLLLNGSADSFGRVTLYGVQLWGSR